MASFCSACSAHRNASWRALASPSACSRSMWMSGMRGFLALEDAMALVLRQAGQPLRFVIEPAPVAADRGVQALETGHQFVVGGLGAERRVVGLRHPLVQQAQARGIDV